MLAERDWNGGKRAIKVHVALEHDGVRRPGPRHSLRKPGPDPAAIAIVGAAVFRAGESRAKATLPCHQE